MKKVLGVILGGLLLLPVVSNAADAQKAADNKKPVNSWTCEDFLAVDESFQPTAVGFAEALNKRCGFRCSGYCNRNPSYRSGLYSG